MGSISVVSTILKTISTFFVALFKQLLNFRIFLFLIFFAKSINKLTRGDYVSWCTIVETKPNTEITRFDGTSFSLAQWLSLLSPRGWQVWIPRRAIQLMASWCRKTLEYHISMYRMHANLLCPLAFSVCWSANCNFPIPLVYYTF